MGQPITRRTLPISDRQRQLLRTAAYLGRTSQQAVIRHGLQLYEAHPEDSRIAATEAATSASILLLIDPDTEDRIQRLLLVTNHSWTGLLRQAIEHGASSLIRQHHTARVA